LNVGCIPSKALLHNSHLYHQAKHDFKGRGIDVKDISLNLPQLMKAKDTSVTQLTKGVEGLFKKNKVTYIKGTGSFASPTTVAVALNDGGETQVEAKNIIIATGSEVTPFPGIEIDEEQIVSSTGALALKKVPEKMTVIGGGVIGLEMASVWSRLGAEVTVVEFLNAIGGAGMDAEIGKSFHKTLEKQGIKFKLGTKVVDAEKKGGKVALNVEGAKDGKKETLESDVVLVAIGRRPVTRGLNLEAVGIELDDKGRVIVDDQYNTTCSGVRAIGDATFGPMLAHKGEEEGIAAAMFIAGKHGHVSYGNIPAVVYTHPEVAWTVSSTFKAHLRELQSDHIQRVSQGKNEEELKTEGVEYKVGKVSSLLVSKSRRE